MCQYIKLSDVRYTNLDMSFDDAIDRWLHVFIQTPEIPSAAVHDIQENMNQLQNVLLAPLLIEKLRTSHSDLHGPFERVGTNIFQRNVAREHMRDLIQVENFRYFNYWTELNCSIKQFVEHTFLYSPELVLAHVNLPFIEEFNVLVKMLEKQVKSVTGSHFVIKREQATTTRFLYRTMFGYPVTITSSIGIFLNRHENSANTWIECSAELPQQQLNDSDSFTTKPEFDLQT